MQTAGHIEAPTAMSLLRPQRRRNSCWLMPSAEPPRPPARRPLRPPCLACWPAGVLRAAATGMGTMLADAAATGYGLAPQCLPLRSARQRLRSTRTRPTQARHCYARMCESRSGAVGGTGMGTRARRLAARSLGESLWAIGATWALMPYWASSSYGKEKKFILSR